MFCFLCASVYKKMVFCYSTIEYKGGNYMVTIKEIADKSGVSTSTVSRILNSDESLKVSSKTRSRVLEIAEKLNYKKIPFTKQSKGVIAITNWYTKEMSVTDLYFRSIRWGAETTLKSAGYNIKRYIFNEELPDSQEVDGIIAIGYYDKQELNKLKKIGKPLVIINQNTLSEGISSVSADYQQPVIEIIDYFSNQGHQAIGLIAASNKNEGEDPRYSAFINEMSNRKLLDTDYIFWGNYSIESGYQAMKNAITVLGEKLPTAFFCISDTMAIGALRALSENNIAVPERVSLIGFGDLEVGKYFSPSLSTVSLATRQMGMYGALTLQNIISGAQTHATHLITSTSLIYRESS